MRWPRSFRSQKRREAELEKELRFHLEEQIREHIAAGMDPDQARRSAALEFGGLDQIKEECRSTSRLRWVGELWQDLRYALRQLCKAPVFAVVAVMTLAIGIGTTTSIFTVVNSVLLRPLVFPESDRLVVLQEWYRPKNAPVRPSPGIFEIWSSSTSAFESIGAAAPLNGNMTGHGDPVRVFGHMLSSGFLKTLQIEPTLGRAFLPKEYEPGKGSVLILNHRFWQTHFGGRADVIDSFVTINGSSFQIIGVMPKGFEEEPGAPHLYTPLSFDAKIRENLAWRSLNPVVARLKASASLETARQEMDLIAARTEQANPGTHKDVGVKVLPLLEFRVGYVQTLLLILLAAVGLLLLIACVNVANLVLLRAISRRREISLRMSLGASRGRIVRQLLVASLVLSAFGGAFGVLIAYATLGTILEFAPTNLPRIDEVRMDGWALAASSAITVLVGIAFGLAPALQASRTDLNEAIKEGGRTAGHGRPRLRHVLVILQVALALCLLAGGGLLARSFHKIQHTHLGYDPEVVFVSRLMLQLQRYPDLAKQVAFAERVLGNLATKPGILASALTTSFPHHQNPVSPIKLEGKNVDDPRLMPQATVAAVTPAYFDVMSSPLIKGRGFSETDRDGSLPVAIISRRMAEELFPGENPLGKRIALFYAPSTWREIIGVVNDVKLRGPTHQDLPQAYIPFAQSGHSQLMLVVRMPKGSPNPAPLVTAAVHGVDPEMPVPPKLVLIAEYVSDSVAVPRFALFLFGVFASVAALLAAVGIYGVMAFSVGQRRREIGVRMALGAHRGDIVRLILGQGVKLVGLGLILGLAGTFAGSSVLRTFLYQLSPYDPATIAGVCFGLLVVAMLSCSIPAYRASIVEPAEALRHD